MASVMVRGKPRAASAVESGVADSEVAEVDSGTVVGAFSGVAAGAAQALTTSSAANSMAICVTTVDLLGSNKVDFLSI